MSVACPQRIGAALRRRASSRNLHPSLGLHCYECVRVDDGRAVGGTLAHDWTNRGARPVPSRIRSSELLIPAVSCVVLFVLKADYAVAVTFGMARVVFSRSPEPNWRPKDMTFVGPSPISGGPL